MNNEKIIKTLQYLIDNFAGREFTRREYNSKRIIAEMACFNTISDWLIVTRTENLLVGDLITKEILFDKNNNVLGECVRHENGFYETADCMLFSEKGHYTATIRIPKEQRKRNYYRLNMQEINEFIDEQIELASTRLCCCYAEVAQIKYEKQTYLACKEKLQNLL